MTIDKQFIEQFISVTSKAALEASYLVGKNNKIAADQAAVDAMRTELNKINMTGEVVIGEGSLDEAPLLYTGEILGTKQSGGIELKISDLSRDAHLINKAEKLVKGLDNADQNLSRILLDRWLGDKQNLIIAQ